MEISSIECEIEMFLERFKCAQSEYLEQNQVPTDCALDVSSPGVYVIMVITQFIARVTRSFGIEM